MHQLAAPQAFLSAEEGKAIFERIIQMSAGGGKTFVSIISEWRGTARWARNRLHLASNTRTTAVHITRTIRGANGSSSTSYLDDAGLRHAVRDAEASMQVTSEIAEQIETSPLHESSLTPTLWSERTYASDAEQRTNVVQSMMAAADDADFLTAGSLAIAATGTATISTEGLFRYCPQTLVECSTTVRDPLGTASGWAGTNHHDLGKIDCAAIAARALGKAKMSQKSVAAEPGRYTVILEPQATADLFSTVVYAAMDRQTAELPRGPFGKAAGQSKITERVLDERLTVRADPMDPEGGFFPYEPFSGVPYQPVTWIHAGILKQLAYSRRYAVAALGLDKALPNGYSYRLAAMPGVQTTTVDEMIRRTERGILVTRFSNIAVLDFESMLCSGNTRDGLWLIENGKIAKPIKNLRFAESPLFMLNNMEDVGESERVFAPRLACFAPAVRARDFNFVAITDTV
jgi:predicted Zn-dependent protease